MTAALSRPARWLLRLAVGPVAGPAIAGDLAELWSARIGTGPVRLRDRLWLWRQIASCLVPGRVATLRRSFPWSLPDHRRFPIRSLDTSTTQVDMFLSDLRYAIRSIRRAPLFTTLVVMTMAAGIAATTIVYSAVDGLVLRPFPFPEPSRLVGVGTVFPKLSSELGFFENLSSFEYLDAAGAESLEQPAAWDMGNRQVTVGETTENLFSGFWFGDAFPALGVAPFLGRGFLPGEITAGARVAVLSHRVWKNRCGADSSLVGGRILVNGEPFQVVGIMAPRVLLYGMDLWIPMGVGPERIPRDRRQFQLIARVAHGSSIERANAELEVIARRVETEFAPRFPEYAGWRLQAVTWNDINVRNLQVAAMVLIGAVGFVMLLVSTNVATLLLGRSTGRAREIALRGALGAGRSRLLRQLLTESVTLALLGALLGVGLGWLGVAELGRVLERQSLPIAGELALNLRVVMVTVAVAVLAGIGFGIVPALQVLRGDVHQTLQATSTGATHHGSRLRVQRILVGIEAALAITLLASGGYLVRSFLALQAVDPGFAPERMLTMRLSLARERYAGDRVEPFFATLREKVAAIPGVTAVATASQFPPVVFLRSAFRIEGAAPTTEGQQPIAYTTLASPGFFETMVIPIRQGRPITSADRLDAPPIVVVNEALARRYFPNESPIGKRIQIGEASAPWFEIVGVVGSTQNLGLDRDPAPEMFASTLQSSGLSNQLSLLVRTEGDPRAQLAAVKAAVQSIDRDQPVYAIRTIDEALARSQFNRRFSAILLATFAGFALILATVGIYGVVSYATSQRTREVGVRMALGASRRSVTALFVRQAVIPVGIGAAVGLAAAVGVGRLMRGLLFGIGSGDATTLIVAAAVLTIACLTAAYLPARRASALDPIRALRSES